MPIFVTEIGTSLSHEPFGPYSLGFPGALGMSMETIQSMSAPNTTVASIDLYLSVADTTNSWFNLSGAARPTYTAYARIFTHLGNDAFLVNVSGDPNVSAIATLASNDGGRRDLLVTNDNLTSNATFSTDFINTSSFATGAAPQPAFADGSPVEVWEWNASPPAYNGTTGYTTSNPATPVPVASYYAHGLPSNWTLSPQSLVLFETYNAPAYPVNFTAELNVPGFPRIPHWFIEVDGSQTSSTEPSLTLLLTTGIHSARGIALLEPPTGTSPKSRLVPWLPSTIVVGDEPMWVNITFQLQWALNLSWNESRGTVIAPQLDGGLGPPANGRLTWWNDSAPLRLEYTTAPGYGFDRWNGHGNGSYSGNALVANLLPTGPVEESADFLPATAVTFAEVGLAPGTLWTVTVRGVEQRVDDRDDRILRDPGHLGRTGRQRHRLPVDHARAGCLVATDPGRRKRRNHPSRELHPARPFRDAVRRHVRRGRTARPPAVVGGGTRSNGIRDHAGTAPPRENFPQPTDSARGLREATSSPRRCSSPSPERIFPWRSISLPQNRVIWNETGLGPGLNWSVLLAGKSLLASSGGWVTDQLLNGSYPYTVFGPQDFVPIPGVRNARPCGRGATVEVQFVLATFGVTFEVNGATQRRAGSDPALGLQPVDHPLRRSRSSHEQHLRQWDVPAQPGLHVRRGGSQRILCLPGRGKRVGSMAKPL